MASKIYRTYTADADGYNALVADVTAATTWSKVDKTDTSATFDTSHGGRLVVTYTGTSITVIALRAGDGATAFQKTGVVKVCFIKTAKVSAMFFHSTTTANFLTAINSGITGVAIGEGINTATGATYSDLMTVLTTTAAAANNIMNVDDSFTTALDLGQYTISTITGADATIALGACCTRSACISNDVLTCIATPLSAMQECAVTVSGKKYYQARYFLFADE